MARRKAKPKVFDPAANTAPPATADQGADARAGRVLIVEGDHHLRRALTAMLRERRFTCDPVASIREACGAMAGAEYDAAVISTSLPDGAGVDVIRAIRDTGGCTRAVLFSANPSLDDAVAAMRCGAVDLVKAPLDDAALFAGVNAAVDQSRREREQRRRVDRLKRICRRLNSARQDVTRQVDSMCNDLVGAYQELTDQLSHVTLASEFGSLVQQELDIESLLRTALEYMLKKTGPTNAAVFLPSNHSDFSLGAYVNYDCPRDTVDVLLDHLADVIAPRFQDVEEIVEARDESALAEWIGDDAHWLAESGVMVASCRHEGECLAVLALFRDRSSPFPYELRGQLRVMADLFARQLAKIVNVHHRHKPDKTWTGWDDWSEEEEDGMGGLAA
ncbi:MAG: response regulator [Planctomycetota bacterium]|nr:response regulator [Planctomycetota bacterium]